MTDAYSPNSRVADKLIDRLALANDRKTNARRKRDMQTDKQI